MLTKQPWVLPGDDLGTEYRQCLEEGRKVERFEPVVKAVMAMENREDRNELAKVLYEEMEREPISPDFPYEEPETLEGIQAARPAYTFVPDRKLTDEQLVDAVKGAWDGRIIGCLLGKPIEGIRRPQMNILMKETGKCPPRDYFRAAELNYDDLNKKFEGKYPLGDFRAWADLDKEASPADDDTTYAVYMQEVLKYHGAGTTALDIIEGRMNCMPYLTCCTAERISYRNAAAGLTPPETGSYQNAHRELVGARIRADEFGFVFPGNPERAAAMAYLDGCSSHVKNGIYSEMFVAAMIAAAPVCNSVDKIIDAGLSQIPKKCRLAEGIATIRREYAAGKTADRLADIIHGQFDENELYGWAHAISNDMLLVLALLVGQLDFTESLAHVVAYGFDTDSNGASLGALLGYCIGQKAIPAHWKAPYHGKLRTFMPGKAIVTVDELAAETLRIMKNM